MPHVSTQSTAPQPHTGQRCPFRSAGPVRGSSPGRWRRRGPVPPAAARALPAPPCAGAPTCRGRGAALGRASRPAPQVQRGEPARPPGQPPGKFKSPRALFVCGRPGPGGGAEGREGRWAVRRGRAFPRPAFLPSLPFLQIPARNFHGNPRWAAGGARREPRARCGGVGVRPGLSPSLSHAVAVPQVPGSVPDHATARDMTAASGRYSWRVLRKVWPARERAFGASIQCFPVAHGSQDGPGCGALKGLLLP